jgi:hypothetical protein
MTTRRDDTAQDLLVLTRLLAGLTADMPAGRQERLQDHLLTEIRLTQPGLNESGTTQPGGAQAPDGPPAAGPRGLRRPRWPQRRRRIILGAAAVLTATAFAATVIGITVPGGGAPLPPTSTGAVRLLAQVADTAARQPVPRIRDSQYVYVETRIVYWGQLRPQRPLQLGQTPRHLHLIRSTLQTWTPVADACRMGLERTEPPPAGFSADTGFSSRGPGVRCPSAGGLNNATYRLLQSLPTDPHALLAMISKAERGHGAGPAQEAFITIGDLLRSTIAPPRVTAALYRAAALVPGVTVVRGATDAIGRHGLAVAQSTGGIRSELIFSKTTLRLIGERTVAVRTGVTSDATAVIATGIANHLGQVPRGAGKAAS